MSDEAACYQYFNDTCTRDETGRFVVRISFKTKEYDSNMRHFAEACLTRATIISQINFFGGLTP